MKSEGVKKDLTIEDIEIRRKQFADNARAIAGYYASNFDLDIFDEMMKESDTDGTIDLMKELTKSYLDKYKEDAELYAICNMAIEYLKIKEKEIGK